MEIQKILENTRKPNQLVQLSSKPSILLPDGLINPNSPFLGEDGNTYSITYSPAIVQQTNCYAFALGIEVPGNPNGNIRKSKNKNSHSIVFGDYIPGFLSTKNLWGNLFNLPNVVKNDLNALNRECIEIIPAGKIPKKLPPAPEGHYWIKAMCVNSSFHFMRKDEKSQRWIQKMGWVEPPKVVLRRTFTLMKDHPMILSRISDLEQKGIPKEISTALLQSYFKAQNLNPNAYTVLGTEYESDDSSNYKFMDEDPTPKVAKTLWVMLISE